MSSPWCQPVVGAPGAERVDERGRPVDGEDVAAVGEPRDDPARRELDERRLRFRAFALAARAASSARIRACARMTSTGPDRRRRDAAVVDVRERRDGHVHGRLGLGRRGRLGRGGRRGRRGRRGRVDRLGRRRLRGHGRRRRGVPAGVREAPRGGSPSRSPGPDRPGRARSRPRRAPSGVGPDVLPSSAGQAARRVTVGDVRRRRTRARRRGRARARRRRRARAGQRARAGAITAPHPSAQAVAGAPCFSCR